MELKRLKEIGEASFSKINYAMLAIFAASIVLWDYRSHTQLSSTSLIVILVMVLTESYPC